MVRLLRLSQLAIVGWTALLALVILSAPGEVYAKLSSSQIDSLRAVGRAQGWTFEVGDNPATQYDLSELCGLKEPANWRDGAPFDDMRSRTGAALALPSSFDWRTQVTGGMPPIRNQGGCGSCWAFSTNGAMECAVKIKDGIDVDLSEQWLVSCNVHGYSCSGGWWVHDMEYNTPDRCGGVGSVMEVNDPYTGTNGTCACPYQHDYKLDGWSYIGGSGGGIPTVSQIKQAIMDHGPVSVAVAVDNAFQGYRGGVFNANTATSINHAVVLVGWNDTTGCWIMRNSWGPYWGESGYMRIAYNTDMIGYNGTYVDYRGRVAVVADTVLGPAPLTVSFQIQTALSAVSYAWNFGDSGTSTLPTPVHTFTQPGQYTVSCNVTCTDGLHTAISRNLIAVYADTLKAPKISAAPGQAFAVDFYARNSLPLQRLDIPVTWAGTAGISVDSTSTVGMRTDYLSTNQWMSFDPSYSMQGTYRLAAASSQDPLPAGAGPVLRLYCSIPASASGSSNPITIESISNGLTTYDPVFASTGGTYIPVVVPGQVLLCVAGDINGDGRVDIGDLAGLVSYLTGGGYVLSHASSANVDGRGIVDSGDLSYMVAYLTSGGKPPVCP